MRAIASREQNRQHLEKIFDRAFAVGHVMPSEKAHRLTREHSL